MSVPLIPLEAPVVAPRIHVVCEDALLAQRLAAHASAAGVSVVGADAAATIVLCCRTIRGSEARAIRTLRATHPHVEVVVVAQTVDVARVRLALQAGASGVILEDRLPDALEPTLAAVSSGQLCLPASFRVQDAKPTLTTREKQILGLVVLGLSNGEIGSKLYLAESTIKSHLSSAFTKLGVRSRNEATARILDPASGLGPGILRVTETLGPTR